MIRWPGDEKGPLAALASWQVRPFTLNDHVGSVLRVLLLLLVAAHRWPKHGIPRRARWAGILALCLTELHSWLARWVRPPGRMLTLSSGRCHVLDEGPTCEAAGGLPPVVLCHGFMGSALYFGGLASALRAAGRRVIRFDNYGRGFSSAGAGPMDASLFVGQLEDLFKQLGLRKVDLVGYSMGGAIAIAFAARHPDLLNSVVLLAPAGMPSCGVVPPAAKTIASVPGGDVLVGLIALSFFARKSKYGGEWELTAPGMVERLSVLHAAEMQRLPVEGFRFAHALGRTLARFPMGGLLAEARDFGRHGVPTLAVWGQRDVVVNFKGLEELRASVPHLQSHVFPAAAHSFPLERFEETAAVMCDFWTRASV